MTAAVVPGHPHRRRRRRGGARLVGVGFGLVAVALVPRPRMAAARGTEPSERLLLRWHAPDGCPSAADVRVRVAALSDPVGDGPPLFVDAKVVRRDDRYALELETFGRAGASTLQVDDPDCSVLADGAALEIALALDHGLPPPPKPAPAAPTSSASTPATIADEPAARCPSCPVPKTPTPTLRWLGLRVDSGFDWGTLPGIGPQLGGSLSLVRAQRWRIAVAGTYWFARRFWRHHDEGTGGVLVGGTAAVLGCGVPPRPRVVELQLCGGVEVGAVAARPIRRGSDVATHRSFRAAAVLAPALVWVIGARLGLVAAAQLSVPFSRYAFDVSGLTYRAKPLAVRGLVGVEVRL